MAPPEGTGITSGRAGSPLEGGPFAGVVLENKDTARWSLSAHPVMNRPPQPGTQYKPGVTLRWPFWGCKNIPQEGQPEEGREESPETPRPLVDG
jgi:hypothetical protein